MLRIPRYSESGWQKNIKKKKNTGNCKALCVSLKRKNLCSHTVAVSKGTIFYMKMLVFCKRKCMLTLVKLRSSRHYKIHFLKLNTCAYLLTKIQVSTIILASCRLGWGRKGVDGCGVNFNPVYN